MEKGAASGLAVSMTCTSLNTRQSTSRQSLGEASLAHRILLDGQSARQFPFPFPFPLPFLWVT